MMSFAVRRVTAFSDRSFTSTSRLLLTLDSILPTGGTTKRLSAQIAPATDAAEHVAKLVSNGMHVTCISSSHINKDYYFSESTIGSAKR
jgi:hypothetical protein